MTRSPLAGLTPSAIAGIRLRQQLIAQPAFTTPADVVSWMGAVQAQDYPGALWAIGLRMRHAIASDIEHALSTRTIVRTWPMRGTLHIVAAADVRWMLTLLTPRIVSAQAGRLKQLEIDARVLRRARKVLVRALEGDRCLSRPAVYQLLESAGISTKGQRGVHITWCLAHDGLICHGARDGKQPTFALLDEWVPRGRHLDRDEALAELARRYFTSHGPATMHDFAWWSGLPLRDARIGAELAKNIVASGVHLRPARPRSVSATPQRAFLLPNYDEYTVAYRDRSAVLQARHAARPDSGNGIFSPTIVVDGQIAGTWTRTVRGESVAITIRAFQSLTREDQRAVAQAAAQYAAFIGKRVA